MLQTDQRNFRLGIAFILALTVWRVLLQTMNGTDLFVDEAQYWLWGQNLDFGYYSKPPMIAWLIRATTELAGSSATFWVRLPAPLLHLALALILMSITLRIYGVRTAAWAGPIYVALPIVTVGSLVISTDTLMLLFFVVAFAMYHRLLERPSVRYALIMGGAIGLGMMSKYAAIYFVIGAVLAAVFEVNSRLAWRDILIAILAALVSVAPNIWWNATHQLTTLRHTANNANWGEGLHPGAAMAFFGSQFIVMGPIFFSALVWVSLRLARQRGAELRLWFFSVPIVLLIIWQALMSQAFANWAAAAYLAGAILVARILVERRFLLWAGQGINIAFALAMPILLVTPERWYLPNGNQLLDRYIGRESISFDAAEAATEAEVGAIVARTRDILADLHYTLRDTELEFYAPLPTDFAQNYYEQHFPVPTDLRGNVIFISLSAAPPCADASLISESAPQDGAYAGRIVRFYMAPFNCFERLIRDADPSAVKVEPKRSRRK